MHKKDVSVVVCTKDKSIELGRCLSSILSNNSCSFEVVVVDQSTDEAAYDVVQKLSKQYSQLRYLRDIGQGLSRARNLGIIASEAPVVAFTDDDCIVAPDWIQRINSEFRDDVVCVCGSTLPHGLQKGKKIGGALRADPEWRRFKGTHDPFRVGTGNNMAFRREVLEEIGLFDEKLGAGTALRSADDTDVIYRVLTSGHAITYSPSALVYHDNWLSSRQFINRRRGYYLGTGAFLMKQATRGDRFSYRLLLTKLLRESAFLWFNSLVDPRRRLVDAMLIIPTITQGMLLWRIHRKR